MKIIGIGRNYQDHIKELANDVPTEPVLFLKPDTAILRGNADFYYPKFTKEIHYEAELIVRICKEGKNIDAKFAHNYYNEIGVGIDFTARDLQQQAKEKGLPWTIAKGFNGSAPISDFVDKTIVGNASAYSFSLKQNGVTKQTGSTTQMLFSIEQLIAYCSIYMTLKTGDIIFTGTPAGVGPIAIGDVLEVFLEDKCMLTCAIK